jgi:hypothetical protein
VALPQVLWLLISLAVLVFTATAQPGLSASGTAARRLAQVPVPASELPDSGADDIAFVSTVEEFQSAVNDRKVPHVVITRHLDMSGARPVNPSSLAVSTRIVCTCWKGCVCRAAVRTVPSTEFCRLVLVSPARGHATCAFSCLACALGFLVQRFSFVAALPFRSDGRRSGDSVVHAFTALFCLGATKYASWTRAALLNVSFHTPHEALRTRCQWARCCLSGAPALHCASISHPARPPLHVLQGRCEFTAPPAVVVWQNGTDGARHVCVISVLHTWIELDSSEPGADEPQVTQLWLRNVYLQVVRDGWDGRMPTVLDFSAARLGSRMWLDRVALQGDQRPSRGVAVARSDLYAAGT